MKITTLEVREIDKVEALSLVFSFHYSKIMPRLTEVYLGGFIDDELVGVITLGWGVRPLHTIRVLFPSLTAKDYYEIGKMCMHEDMPKNSESVFLSRTIRWLKQNKPDKKLLFTWADGTLGKPGYVYQSANFLYGGYIWTDLYMSEEGERIHPRSAQGITSRHQKKQAKYGHRPTRQQLKEFGWNHYKGKQFRYLQFLCDKREKRRLLKESSVEWNIEYPKSKDLEWKIRDLNAGGWKPCSSINYDPTITSESNRTFQRNERKVWTYEKSKEFFNI